MISSDEFFTLEDIPLLEQDATVLAVENDATGVAEIQDILQSLGVVNLVERVRALGQRKWVDNLPYDRLLTVNPRTVLASVFTQLDPFTQNCLERAEDARSTLGESPGYARAVGVYIAVGFENELIHRAEEAFLRHNSVLGNRRPHLYELWRFCRQMGQPCARLGTTIKLRNRIAHAPVSVGGETFGAVQFNRLLSQVGLVDPGSRGAFHELASLRLPG